MLDRPITGTAEFIPLPFAPILQSSNPSRTRSTAAARSRGVSSHSQSTKTRYPIASKATRFRSSRSLFCVILMDQCRGLHLWPSRAARSDRSSIASAGGSPPVPTRPYATLDAMIPTELNNALESNPEVLGGTVCFRGTRVPFETLLDIWKTASPSTGFFVAFRPSPANRPSTL